MLTTIERHGLALLGADPATLGLLEAALTASSGSERGAPPAPAAATVGGTAVGRVARTERTRARVLTPAGPVGVALGVAPDVCVGDWVCLTAGAAGSDATITQLLPRRVVLRRGDAAGLSGSQLLATNVDRVGVVAGLDAGLPATKTERFLAAAWDSGALPVVVLTKADLLDAEEQEAARAAAASLAPGAEVVVVSTRTGQGLPELGALLGPGRSLALLGISGSGKSSLVNALVGSALVPVGELSGAHSKGRHTTTWRELVVLPGGGAVIDTPGLRGLAVRLEAGVLDVAFADIAELAADCRYRDCGHRAEPGCAVLAAVDAGVIDARRLASLRKLEREAAWAERRSDARLQAEARRQWAARARQSRTRSRP